MAVQEQGYMQKSLVGFKYTTAETGDGYTTQLSLYFDAYRTRIYMQTVYKRLNEEGPFTHEIMLHLALRAYHTENQFVMEHSKNGHTKNR